MTNAEKFKTSEERAKAFRKFCRGYGDSCNGCKVADFSEGILERCAFSWLDREAEEENMLPCPFCGGTDVVVQDFGGFEIVCQRCGFHTPPYVAREELISEYQRVARAVMAASGSEENKNEDS